MKSVYHLCLRNSRSYRNLNKFSSLNFDSKPSSSPQFCLTGAIRNCNGRYFRYHRRQRWRRRERHSLHVMWPSSFTSSVYGRRQRYSILPPHNFFVSRSISRFWIRFLRPLFENWCWICWLQSVILEGFDCLWSTRRYEAWI